MRKFKAFHAVDPAEWWFPPSFDRPVEPSSAEPTRQWILRELIASHGYPAEWLAARATFEDRGPGFEFEDGILGIRLRTETGDPFLWLVVAEPGRAEDAESALRECLRRSPLATAGLSADGSPDGVKVLRKRPGDGGFEYLPDIDSYMDPRAAAGRKPLKIRGSRGRDLAPLSASAEDVFFEAHCRVRDVDGLHADEALDELCKYIRAKLHDEESSEDGRPYRLQPRLYGATEEFAAAARRTYLEAAERDARASSPKPPGGDGPRGGFGTPIRLSSPALATVAEAFQDHGLSTADVDVKGRAFQKLIWPCARAGMGQYFTPRAVIDFVVNVVDPDVQERVLDPFAGSGYFLVRALDAVRSKREGDASGLVEEFAFKNLHGFEKSGRMARVAMTDMRLRGDGRAEVRCADSLLDFSNYPDVRPESFDVVMTNPPFGSLLGPEAVARLGAFALARGRRSVPLEVLGLERCLQFLRPGGRLGIVLPDGILANKATRHVRDWLADHARIRAIVSLPIETFAPFGANVKTSVLLLRKLGEGERPTTACNVFLARIDDVGHDAAGRPREALEFEAAAGKLREFLRKEGW